MEEYIKLKLKVLIKTEDYYMVDLGTGKVWINCQDIRSTRRVNQGIYEMEILKEVIEQKRRDMIGLKEKATGVGGSVLGEVIALEGKVLREEPDALEVEIEGRKFFFPRCCFSKIKDIGDGLSQLSMQKDFYEYKLWALETNQETSEWFTEIEVRVNRETDRAYCFELDGREVWYPKRGIIECRDIPGREEKMIKVPADFWRFKLA